MQNASYFHINVTFFITNINRILQCFTFVMATTPSYILLHSQLYVQNITGKMKEFFCVNQNLYTT